MPDSGPVTEPAQDAGVSRRGLLLGLAGAAVVIGGGAGGLDYEVGQHPSLRRRIFGCPSTPPIPHSTYTVTSGTTRSAAMGTTEPWLVALPRDHTPSQPIPLVVALPGLGGGPDDLTTGVGLPGFATAAGLRLAFACPGGAASTYYHPRTNGTNCFAWITDEFVPMVERRFGVGGSRALRGVYGSSMGGFGALLIGLKRPDLVSAVTASSPAVFPSYRAAVTGHPDTFDSLADWQQWGFWPQAATMHDVAVRVDCGDEDVLAPTTRALLARIPGATGRVGTGCHANSFFRSAAAIQLQFLASHPTA
jgi:S-formylglutathione hydrolase FrmB